MMICRYCGPGYPQEGEHGDGCKYCGYEMEEKE